jgi:hypothetical protein
MAAEAAKCVEPHQPSKLTENGRFSYPEAWWRKTIIGTAHSFTNEKSDAEIK